jgi:RNA-splicing ligase RtcB
MAGIKLDGAGQAKMATLEEAMNQMGRVNSIVEQYAMAVKRNQPTSLYTMQLRRVLPTLAQQLKGQFGMISDQVTAMFMASSRGGGDAVKVRACREGVAQVKVALEIAIAQTLDKHEVHDEKKPAAPAAE